VNTLTVPDPAHGEKAMDEVGDDNTTPRSRKAPKRVEVDDGDDRHDSSLNEMRTKRPLLSDLRAERTPEREALISLTLADIAPDVGLPAAARSRRLPPTKMTPEDVRRWWGAAGFDDAKLDAVSAQAIANHCNRFWREWELKQFTHRAYGIEIKKFRRLVQQARSHPAAYKKNFPRLISSMKTWTDEEKSAAGMAELLLCLKYPRNVRIALNIIARFLAPTRRRGGQNVPWAEFVDRLDHHLMVALSAGLAAQPGSPVVAFMISAVDAVFGTLAIPGDGNAKDRHEPMAKLITRLRTARRKAGIDTQKKDIRVLG
jgi:hypothetical protein